MSKIKVLVVGCGRVGREVATAVKESPDMELAAIVEQSYLVESLRAKFHDVPVITHGQVGELGHIDVAILAIGSRAVPEVAPIYLRMGINTVDAYDIHGEGIMKLRKDLDKLAKEHRAVAIVSAGWDPGTDSIVRALMEVIAPRGITYTNFGPGMSMGHTVTVKSVEGVEDAISITIPKGTGLHKRMVYVKVKEGYEFEKVAEKILNDPYFAHDETYVCEVEDVGNLLDMGHSVKIERKGVSAGAHNQRMEFTMSVNNPAATAQVMVSAARASMRQNPGCYTLLEIPLVDFLYGEKEKLLSRLV